MSYTRQDGTVENGVANAEITPMHLPATLETRSRTALKSFEAKWKYYRRYTIGTTGTNLRMPLDIFIASHIKYVRDLSMKHYLDMANDAGIVVFPMYPSITTELWKKVRSIDPRIIQLSHVEGGLQYRTAWDASVLST
jgi:hypothetical protein